MSEEQREDQGSKVAVAAMGLFAERGYAAVTLDDVAEAVGCSRFELRAHVDGKAGLLTLFLRQVDTTVLGEDAGYGADESVRDKLFDLLMRRFDTLNPHRAGIKAVLRDLPRDPFTVVATAPSAMEALAWYLRAAGTSVDGIIGLLRVKGLSLVWLHSFQAFLKDDSEDLAQTMAALDKALAQAEKAAGWVQSRGTRKQPADGRQEVLPP